MRTEPVRYWRIHKGETAFILMEHQLPEDVRQSIIKTYNDAGYGVSEEIRYK